MEVWGAWLQPMGPLLTALLPHGRPLRRLELGASALRRRSFQDCISLAAMTALRLRDVDISAGSIDTVFRHLLAQAPLLADLTLEACGEGMELQQIPRSLAGMRGLARLTLFRNALQDLPPGPYLSGEHRSAAGSCRRSATADTTLAC